MIKTVIFDFDGTIADTYDMCYKICEQAGCKINEKIWLEHHDGNVYDKPKIKFDEGNLKEYIRMYNEKLSKVLLFPIKKEIIRLNQDYNLYIVSSNNEIGINKFLKETDLKQYFKKVMGLETERSKIKKFAMIFQAEKIKPQEAVFFGDTLGDMKEGKKAQLKTIGVTWGFHLRERLLKGKPDMIIDEFSEIGSVINNFC